jgi:dihydroneopterin aldolase
VRISLAKPGAFRHARDVGVSIERWRQAPAGQP